MKLPVLLFAAALALAACTVGNPIRSESSGPERSQGGGSAGSRGPLYCQTVPAGCLRPRRLGTDLRERALRRFGPLGDRPTDQRRV